MASGALWAAAPGQLPPPADQGLAHALLAELVATRTTHDRGSTQAAELIRQQLLKAGFDATDVVLIAPPDHPTKGNVVVRYRGKGKGRPVLFLGHLDVVEADAADWTVDPFTLTEKDGWFYGRGSIDMKDGDAALVESLLRLRREHFVPERDLIVALTADEEAGGDANGPAFLLKEHRELIDAELAINLDGGGGAYKDGERLYYALGTAEKTYATFTAQTVSAGGHGSVPGPDNAIYHLAAGLTRLQQLTFPLELSATTRASLTQLAALYPDQSTDMHAVAEHGDAAAAARLSVNPRLNAQLHTTCVPTLLSGGQAENALPEHARATIQCRLLPGDDIEQVQSALSGALADPSIALTLDAPPIISPESPPTPAILARIGAVVHGMWPGVPIVPVMSTGYSDDRQTRNAGIPSYDAAGVWINRNENRAHGRDERLGVREFDESVEYTYRLMKAMARTR